MESGGSLALFSGVGAHSSSPRVIVSALADVVLSPSSPQTSTLLTTPTITTTPSAARAGAALVRAERRAVWRAQLALIGARSGVSTTALNEAGTLLGRSAYADVVAERALAGCCGYAACGALRANPPLALSAREALDREAKAEKEAAWAASHASSEAIATDGPSAGPIAGAASYAATLAALAPTQTDELANYCSRWCWRASVFFAAQLPEAPPGSRASAAAVASVNASGVRRRPRIEVVPCLAVALSLRIKRGEIDNNTPTITKAGEGGGPKNIKTSLPTSSSSSTAAITIAQSLLPVIERVSSVALPITNIVNIDTNVAAFVIDGTRPVYPPSYAALTSSTSSIPHHHPYNVITERRVNENAGDAEVLPSLPPVRVLYDEEDIIDLKKLKISKTLTTPAEAPSSSPLIQKQQQQQQQQRRKSLPSLFFSPILDASKFAKDDDDDEAVVEVESE